MELEGKTKDLEEQGQDQQSQITQVNPQILVQFQQDKQMQEENQKQNADNMLNDQVFWECLEQRLFDFKIQILGSNKKNIFGYTKSWNELNQERKKLREIYDNFKENEDFNKYNLSGGFDKAIFKGKYVFKAVQNYERLLELQDQIQSCFAIQELFLVPQFIGYFIFQVKTEKEGEYEFEEIQQLAENLKENSVYVFYLLYSIKDGNQDNILNLMQPVSGNEIMDDLFKKFYESKKKAFTQAQQKQHSNTSNNKQEDFFKQTYYLKEGLYNILYFIQFEKKVFTIKSQDENTKKKQEQLTQSLLERMKIFKSEESDEVQNYFSDSNIKSFVQEWIQNMPSNSKYLLEKLMDSVNINLSYEFIWYFLSVVFESFDKFRVYIDIDLNNFYILRENNQIKFIYFPKFQINLPEYKEIYLLKKYSLVQTARNVCLQVMIYNIFNFTVDKNEILQLDQDACQFANAYNQVSQNVEITQNHINEEEIQYIDEDFLRNLSQLNDWILFTLNFKINKVEGTIPLYYLKQLQYQDLVKKIEYREFQIINFIDQLIDIVQQFLVQDLENVENNLSNSLISIYLSLKQNNSLEANKKNSFIYYELDTLNQINSFIEQKRQQAGRSVVSNQPVSNFIASSQYVSHTIEQQLEKPTRDMVSVNGQTQKMNQNLEDLQKNKKNWQEVSKEVYLKKNYFKVARQICLLYNAMRDKKLLKKDIDVKGTIIENSKKDFSAAIFFDALQKMVALIDPSNFFQVKLSDNNQPQNTYSQEHSLKIQFTKKLDPKTNSGINIITTVDYNGKNNMIQIKSHIADVNISQEYLDETAFVQQLLEFLQVYGIQVSLDEKQKLQFSIQISKTEKKDNFFTLQIFHAIDQTVLTVYTFFEYYLRNISQLKGTRDLSKMINVSNNLNNLLKSYEKFFSKIQAQIFMEQLVKNSILDSNSLSDRPIFKSNGTSGEIIKAEFKQIVLQEYEKYEQSKINKIEQLKTQQQSNRENKEINKLIIEKIEHQNISLLNKEYIKNNGQWNLLIKLIYSFFYYLEQIFWKYHTQQNENDFIDDTFLEQNIRYLYEMKNSLKFQLDTYELHNETIFIIRIYQQLYDQQKLIKDGQEWVIQEIFLKKDFYQLSIAERLMRRINYNQNFKQGSNVRIVDKVPGVTKEGQLDSKFTTK